MKKIDIYLLKRSGGSNSGGFWRYEASTTQSKTCREAKAKYCAKYGVQGVAVRCNFSK